uniref:AMP-dependent synthetase/ligase domain-containing protein n=1 Tax=Lactuca sativa TaxID=4236 RepID=A0A9R1XQS5_LACSA|nr:hypothetical protein LSAT_V11C200059850 [Lactuca sativa]
MGENDSRHVCFLPMFHISGLGVVPPVMIHCAKHDVVKKFDLSSLDNVGSGATPLRTELMEECAKKFPHVTFIQVKFHNSIPFELFDCLCTWGKLVIIKLFFFNAGHDILGISWVSFHFKVNLARNVVWEFPKSV